jgi:hypothetical protein
MVLLLYYQKTVSCTADSVLNKLPSEKFAKKLDAFELDKHIDVLGEKRH